MKSEKIKLNLKPLDYKELQKLIDDAYRTKKDFSPMESVGDYLAVVYANKEVGKFLLEKIGYSYYQINENSVGIYQDPLRIYVEYSLRLVRKIGEDSFSMYPETWFSMNVYPQFKKEGSYKDG